MIQQTYYTMKRRLGGEKMPPWQKLLHRWYPCPGCIYHADLIGARRAGILFERYHKLDKKAHLIYWRTHPAEWKHIRDTVNS